MEQKRYIKEIYSKSWLFSRERHYGFSDYDKNLCSLVIQLVPEGSKILEVAVGTGYPIADFLQKCGYKVCGVDISPDLIEKCRLSFPNISCQVGDAEDLPYTSDHFEAVYCFHSTWYFPDLLKAIDEMIRVTHPGGYVIFDIQNRNNIDIASSYQKRIADSGGMRKLIRIAKNAVLVVLRRNELNLHFLLNPIVHEAPIYPERIYEHLKGRVFSLQVWTQKNDQSLEQKNELDLFAGFARLVLVVRK